MLDAKISSDKKMLMSALTRFNFFFTWAELSNDSSSLPLFNAFEKAGIQ
jgi:hypothetical protein